MRISRDWLADWVDLDETAETLAEELTIAGLEVDDVLDAAPDLKGIVVAEVRSVTTHPNADRLSLCTVFDGSQVHQIVCGAPNVRAGIRVPFAPIGTVLPGGLRIKAAKIRGERSSGMLCSAKELALSEDAEGLLILDEAADPGVTLSAYLRLPDVVIDVDLTPNRGDCFSVIGIARELAARRGRHLKGPAFHPVVAGSEAAHEPTLDSPADCPRFATRVIQGLDVQARTPDWMRERLRRSGLRPISPVVDVTNYVMLELGQPLHAYDADRLTGRLRARRGQASEPLTLLDDTEIELSDDVLVIADDSGAVGLAGVMGGASTAIDTSTENVVLESAFFSQAVIQGRARRYGLHTDASMRFERGVDPTGQVRALERATDLLLAMAGGQAGPVVVADDIENLPTAKRVHLRQARVAEALGVEIDGAQISEWLGHLGMTLHEANEGWEVTAPAHRFDIAIEEDLIEEIGRMFGYDNIPVTPGVSTIHLGRASERGVCADDIADSLAARGYDETISYSFIEPGTDKLISGPVGDAKLVELENPISADLSIMRQSLLPGLIKAARQNLSRQRGRCQLFEIGTVFRSQSGLQESSRVAGIAVGSVRPEHWDDPSRAVDFYDVKGDVEALLGLTGRGGDFDFKATSRSLLNPANAAEIHLGGESVGLLGRLHPSVERRLDLSEGAVVFELDLASAFQVKLPKYRPFSKFPFIRRDLALVVAETVHAADLTKLVSDELGEHLYRAVIFDEYRGENLNSGSKSIGLGLILQDVSRTLTDADADQMLASATKRLESEIGATIRT